jgi:hypothetical protein
MNKINHSIYLWLSKKVKINLHKYCTSVCEKNYFLIYINTITMTNTHNKLIEAENLFDVI